MSARPESAAVAVLCFLACIAIALVAVAQHLLRVHGPAIREVLLWCADPRTGIGMGLGLLVACAVALLLAKDAQA